MEIAGDTCPSKCRGSFIMAKRSAEGTTSGRSQIGKPLRTKASQLTILK